MNYCGPIVHFANPTDNLFTLGMTLLNNLMTYDDLVDNALSAKKCTSYRICLPVVNKIILPALQEYSLVYGALPESYKQKKEKLERYAKTDKLSKMHVDDFLFIDYGWYEVIKANVRFLEVFGDIKNPETMHFCNDQTAYFFFIHERVENGTYKRRT